MTTPIQTVLSVTQAHGVRSLLMGGQACVLYGAAEFSRDIDLAILADAANLQRLTRALAELGAEVIAVPPFEVAYLERGHAIHFRCAAAGGLWLDVMSRMRNVASFESCWSRRSTFTLAGAGPIEIMGLSDLVSCKKTRRDKDWPMVRRLVDVSYLDTGAEPTPERLEFWLKELRTPSLLIDCVRRAPEAAARVSASREAVSAAAAAAFANGPEEAITLCLSAEESRERAADEEYWRPLLAELEALRRSARRQ